MGSSKKVTIGYKIRLGIHQLLCRGPVDAIKRIRVDEKTIYENSTGLADESTVIDKANLFGGKKQEGGIAGTLDVQLGSPTQEKNDYLVSQLGENIPSFRGVVGVILNKMYLGTQPYLKKWDFRVQRIHTRQDGQTQWYDAKAACGRIRQPETTRLGWWGMEGDFFIIGASQEYTGPFQYLQTTWDGYIDSLRITKKVCRYNTLSIDPITEPYSLAGDEHASNVVVLNNFNGNDGDTPSTDDTGNTTTWGWTAKISTDQFKFGTSSARFYESSNGNDYLKVDADPDLTSNFSSNEFTIECWGYLISKKSGTYGRPLVSCGKLSTSELDSIWGVYGDYLRWNKDDNIDSYDERVFGYLNNITLNEWHHFALTRDQFGYVRMYVDFEMVVGYASDMNPAHIIRECLTDPDWGMGYPEDDIDSDSFETAANTLYNEDFGLSLAWDEQKPIQDFLSDILEHIDAALFVSKETGKFKLKLIRDDYNDTGLVILDEDSVVSVDDFHITAFGELVNSVAVKFYNAELSKDDAVQIQDIALVQQQDAVIETTINYPGIRNPALAARVAERDLKALSTPLVSCTVYSDRTAAQLEIGDAFILDWPDYQIDNLVMRVTGIAYGDDKTNTIKITCVQDIFDTQTTAIIANPTIETPALDTAPKNAVAVQSIETPYYVLARAFGDSDIDSILTANPSAGYLTSFGGRENGGQLNGEMWTNSGSGYVEQVTFDFCPYAVPAPDSAGYLLDETTTTVFIQSGQDISTITPPTFCLMGDEWMRVDSIVDGSDGIWEMTVGRGCLDSIPQQHTIDSSGQYIYFLEDLNGFDTTEYNAAETISSKILSNTLTDTLSIDNATETSVTFDSRAIRPYPPGNVKINGERFPSTIGQEFITLTWAHRDRTQQTGSTIEDHFDGDIGPETGTTYNIRFYDELGQLVKTVSTSDTSYVWTTEPTDSGFRSSNTEYTYEEECLEYACELLWHFDETSGTTAYDTSGNYRDGTYTADASINQSPLITGGKSVTLSSNLSDPVYGAEYIPFTTAISISLFIRVDPDSGWGSNGVTLVSQGRVGYYPQFSLDLDDNGVTNLRLYRQNSPTDKLSFTPSGTIMDGAVHHVVFTWERAGDYKARCYIDGVLDSESTPWNFDLVTQTALHKIACGYDFDSHARQLDLDGLALFSQALDSDEVKRLYDSRVNTGSDTEVVFNDSVRIELESERDGYTSLHMYDMTVTRV